MSTAIFLAGFLPALLGGAEGPEDKLLQAELLEVSTGDLEKAMAAYKGLMADEKAPAAVRARAQLCLARCQRKRGELEAARKNLEDLLKGSPDREIARQAQSFLKELQGGRAENPDFDWLKEMEKNPEIQARVFELVMDLVDLQSDAGKRADRQLLAMGTLALPVVERVIESSRDPLQRLALALIAVRAGRFERLSVLLDPTQRLDSHWYLLSANFKAFLDSIAYLGDAERRRLLETISKLPASPATEPWASAIQLAAGDFSDFPRKLRDLEKIDLLDSSMLSMVMKSHPPAVQEIAGRILDKTLTIQDRDFYLGFLLRNSPASLGKEHLAVVEEIAQRPRPFEEYIPFLEKRGEFEILKRLTATKASRSIQDYFKQNYYRPSANLSEAPGEWAAVLRRLKGESLMLLHLLAEVKDDAVPELVGFLQRWGEEEPEYKGYGIRTDKEWSPSQRYAEAMAGLLKTGDSLVLSIALEALALAPKGTGPEVLPSLEGLILGPPNMHVREFALYAMLLRSSSRPETGPEVARILLADFSKHAEAPIYYSTSLPSALGKVRHSHPGGLPQKGYDNAIIGWVIDAVPKDALLSLLPHVLALKPQEKSRQFLSWFYRKLPRPQAEKAVLSRLSTLKSPGERESAIFIGSQSEAGFLAKVPEGLEFLRSAAQDPGLGADSRMSAVELGGKEALGWFDWPKLLASEDPLLEQFGRDPFSQTFDSWLKGLSQDEQGRIFEALRASKLESLRAWRIQHYPISRPDRLAVLEKGLGDPSEVVQRAAIQAILDEGLDNPQLLFRILETPMGKKSPEVFGALENLASPESLGPLVKLLDDPNSKVRSMALTTLNAIRTHLRQKQEWQDMLKALEKKS